MPIIDVIIPVFRGFRETKACIESVLESAGSTAQELVVIDDCSPEPQISTWLDTLATSGAIRLLRNDENLGFVRSVNRAMELHPDRDVILLNSDTVVARGWLDRIVSCAARNANAASICPFSNNATLASYPRIAQGNALPQGETVASLDALFAATQAGACFEVPTTVGFCMYLRRAVLDEIGLFDAEAFGRGYGEENDWCMRASASGYTHLIAADVFVYHQGEVSFAEDAAGGKANAQTLIDQRYPEYRGRIADHLRQDPAREFRRAVDIARLTRLAIPKLLFITHDWGGGTEQHVNDLVELVGEAAQVLVLKPRMGHPGEVSLSWCTGKTIREEFQAWFNLNEEREALIGFLAHLGIARVHLHHIHAHESSVLDIARDLGVPMDVTLHDYFPLTPQYHLDHGGAVPEREIPHAWGWPLSRWRQTMGTMLAQCERVICPSTELASRISAAFPGIDPLVWQHPETRDSTVQTPVKVLILGGLTIDKGQNIVLSCARDAMANGHSLHFVVLGHTEDALPRFPDLPIEVRGSYRAGDIDRLIALEHADVAWFPSQIPESYSYTLSAAMRHGLPVVASKLGAFPERLAHHANAKLIDWNATPGNWNATLMDAAGGRAVARVAWAPSPAEEYRAKYLSALGDAKATNTPPKLAAHHYFASHALPAGAETPLSHLYTAAIECGYAPRREEFRQRVMMADGNLAAARQEASAAYGALREVEDASRKAIAELQAAYADLEKVANDANSAYQGVVNSTTWKMTGPLRSAIHRLKSIRRRFAHAAWRITQLPQNIRNASHLAREEGVAAVGHKVVDKLTGRGDPYAAPLPTYAVLTTREPIRVPYSETPRWSILIPVHGQHDFTYTCLKSIAETCAGLSIEVVVVDDCSETPASEALSIVSGVKIRRNEGNLGFLRSCNAAAANLRGEFIVLLNNDTLVTGEWLEALTAVFDDDEKAGLAGAKLLFGNGRLQEAGGIVWRDGSASNYGRNEDPRRPEFNYRREADYCSAACVMIRRSLWDALEGFDERYVPAYYEDTDLAFRVREAGYKVIYQPHAEVVHFEGKSSGTDLTQGVKRHQVINQRTFEARWRHVLAAHRAHGHQVHLECDRKATRRVLVIDVCLVMPDRDSGSLRMYEILKGLRQLGCRVSFVADNRQHVEKYARLTQSLGVEVLHAPYLSTPGEAITRHGAHYDVVILSRAPVAVSHVDAVKKLMPHAKLVFDTVDLHFLRQEREAEVADDDALRADAARMKKIELDLIAKADATLVVSSAEKDLLETLAPRAKVHVVSNIHEPAPGARPFSARSGLVFIGGFRFAPNVDAMVWFASEILPLLRANGTGIRTTVIGSDVPEELRRFAADDFKIAGYVPDIAPLYDKARIAIAPLRFGAGVKGKVNTAMQYGVPVVATPCAVEGMHLVAGEDMLTAGTPQAFADAIARLHSDEALWAKLRQGGLNNIERWFSRARARQVLRTLLDI